MASQTSTGGKSPSRRSVFGLDWTNLLLADVQQGVGPYLVIYLAGPEHWTAGPVGLAVAASSIVSAVAQVPVGLLIDATRAKRLLVVLSSLLLGIGAFVILLFPGFWPVLGAQAMLGLAASVVPPAIAALSLGLVGRRKMPARISRNQGFNHMGAFGGAVLFAAVGSYASTMWIFAIVAFLSVLASGTTLMIRPNEIDHRVARGGDRDEDGDAPDSLLALLRRPVLLVFLAALLVFQLSNAAMLSLAGQVLARHWPGQETTAMSGCILVAQFVMMGVAWSTGLALKRCIGRKTLLLIAFAMLPLRGVLFALTVSPVAMACIEVLDGIAGGIFSVIVTVIAADLTRGSGRFNFLQSLGALAVGLGTSLSNVAAGQVVQHFGSAPGFAALAAVGVLGLLLVLACLPETGERAPARERAEVAFAEQ